MTVESTATQGLQNTKIQEDALYTLDLSHAFEADNLGALLVFGAQLAPLNIPGAADGNNPIPDWLKLNTETGLLQGTPSHSDANKIHKIEVVASSASDTSLTSTYSFYLLVENTNDAPVISGTYTATVSKSESSSSVFGSISATDIDGNIGWELDPSSPFFSDYTSSTNEDGSSVEIFSNPFGDSLTVSSSSAGTTYTEQHRDGLSNTETWSFDQSSGLTVQTMSSSSGANSTITSNPVDGGLFVDTVATFEGSIDYLEELYQLNDFTLTYRTYPADDSDGGIVSSTGSLVGDDTVYYPAIDDKGVLALVSRPSDAPSSVYDTENGLEYTFASHIGTYGTIDLDENFNWVYTLDTTDTDTVGLASGMSATDTFTLSVSDGEATTTQLITIDVLGGGAGSVLNGTSGIDVFTTGLGADVIYAQAGNDAITLTADSVWGAGYVAKTISNDSSVGTNEKVALDGLNRFSDVIDGGADTDTLSLTDGNDAFFIDDVYSGHNSSLTLVSTAQSIDSTARIINLEMINAGAGNDIVDLTSNNFVLTNAVDINGGAGNDTLWGSNGNDAINGGDGDDSIFGGTGSDTLTGGAGSDSFQFTATAGSDVITDFNASGDLIQLYYRAEDNHNNTDLNLADGVLTWDVDNTNSDVVIDLSATTNSSDLADFDTMITFVEIV